MVKPAGRVAAALGSGTLGFGVGNLVSGQADNSKTIPASKQRRFMNSSPCRLTASTDDRPGGDRLPDFVQTLPCGAANRRSVFPAHLPCGFVAAQALKHRAPDAGSHASIRELSGPQRVGRGLTTSGCTHPSPKSSAPDQGLNAPAPQDASGFESWRVQRPLAGFGAARHKARCGPLLTF